MKSLDLVERCAAKYAGMISQLDELLDEFKKECEKSSTDIDKSLEDSLADAKEDICLMAPYWLKKAFEDQARERRKDKKSDAVDLIADALVTMQEARMAIQEELEGIPARPESEESKSSDSGSIMDILEFQIENLANDYFGLYRGKYTYPCRIETDEYTLPLTSAVKSRRARR